MMFARLSAIVLLLVALPVAAQSSSGGFRAGQPVTATVSAALTNPSSSLATPASATAYTAGQLVCTSATAATCNTALASEYFTIPNAAGGFVATRMRLANSDTTATSYGGVVMQIDLWSAAPTMANGDRGAFSPASGTGQGTHLAGFSCTMSAVYGNGTYSECAPVSGTTPQIKLASGTSVFWTLQAIGASGVTSSSSTTWTAYLEASN